MDQGNDEEQVKLGPMDFKGHTLLQTGHHNRFVTPITATLALDGELSTVMTWSSL
jgi:hypothetical protein